jgi:hypothetical protein
MNLSQLRERYSEDRVVNWLRTLAEPVESHPPETRDVPNRFRETLSRLRGEQEITFVRLAASAQLQEWPSSEQSGLVYMPVSPVRAAHLFLAYVIRQVRISGLFARQWPSPQGLGDDAVFLSLLEWLGGLRPSYPADQDYWLARNRMSLFQFRVSASQRTVGPILSLFMLGYCVQEKSGTVVSRFASRDLVRILSSGSLLATDEWARSAIVAGGIELARVRASVVPEAL